MCVVRKLLKVSKQRQNKNTRKLSQNIPENKNDFDEFRKWRLNFRSWKLQKVMEKVMQSHGI